MSEKETRYARWLSGQLDENEKEAMQQSGELKELEAILKATDEWTLPRLDTQKAYEQFSKQNKQQKSQLSVARIRPLLSAAAVALALLITALFILQNPTQKSAGYAQNLTIALEDETTIVLNDGSALQYSKREWNKNRIVELTGEAYFEVSKGGAPFLVQTALGQVQVLGTAFNVRTWDERLDIECYEGKVSVSQNEQLDTLSAGSALIVQDGQSSRKNIPHRKPRWQGEEAQTHFSNLAIKWVLDELERQYDVKLQRPSLQDIPPISGSFNHDDLESALVKVCKPAGLSFNIEGEHQKTVILTKNK